MPVIGTVVYSNNGESMWKDDIEKLDIDIYEVLI